MTAEQLEAGYWRAYRDFYRWGAHRPRRRDASVLGPAAAPRYAAGWKKFEPLWDVLIRTGQVLHALPLLEAALGSFGARRPARRVATNVLSPVT